MERLIAIIVVLMFTVGPLAPAMGPWTEADLNPPIDGIEGMEPTMVSPGAAVMLSEIDGFFTENLGQHGGGAGRFYCVGEPLSVALGPGWAAYQHMGEGGKEGVLVRVEFVGGDPVEPFGEDPLPHPTNYFKGRDPDGWVVGARSYREVVYEDLWDGIDLVWRLADGALKYDLVVEPNADLSQVALRYSGQSSVVIDEATGDLVVRTPVVDLRDSAPASFQGGLEVPSRFVLLDDRTVSFEVPGRDPSLSLVIDPGLTFGTYLGGDDWDGATLVVDDAGDIYLAGYTRSGDFHTTPGVIFPNTIQGQDGIVVKLNSDCTHLIFSTFLGSSAFDGCLDIELGPDGSILIAGQTFGSDFPTTSGAYQTEPDEGNGDAFVTKLNHNCSEILWSTFLSGMYNDGATAIKRTSNGDLMLMGFTWSPDFPVVSGCLDTNHNGDIDIFVARLSPDGSTLVRSTYIGGSAQEDIGVSVLEMGPDDEVYIAIKTASPDFPTTPNAFSRNLGGCHDAALVKLDGNLTTLDFSTLLGGSDHDAPYAMTINEAGNMYVLGSTGSTDFPVTPGAWQMTNTDPENWDCFIAEISDNGSAVVFGTYYGGVGTEIAEDLHLDDQGMLYFLMTTQSERLPTTEHAINSTNGGEYDFYLGVMDCEEQAIRFGTYLGGSMSEFSWPEFIVDGSTVIMVGQTASYDFPTTPGAYDEDHNGGGDIVVCGFKVQLSDTTIPGPPFNLTARLDGTRVRLDWESPMSWGGFSPWGYHLYRGLSADNLTRLRDIGPLATNLTDTTVELGSTYHYAISTYNPMGESPRTETVTIRVVTLPGPPTELVAEAGCETVRLTWRAPTYTGGLPIAGYSLHRGTSPEELDHLVVLENSTQHVDTGLVNGQTYHYRLSAFNEEGNGTTTPIVSSTPVGPPSPPLAFEAIPGDGKVTLQWERPVNSGGRSLLGYRLWRGTEPDVLASLEVMDWTTTEWTDGPLQNGVTYYYAVSAYNLLGDGPRTPVIAAIPVGRPGMPGNLQADEGDGWVTLTWEAPDDAGSPITGYTVYRGTSAITLTTLEVIGPTTLYTDDSAINGQTYFYAVMARNALGDGPRTGVITATPSGGPGSPHSVVAKAGRVQVTISWLRPTHDGGSTIDHYVLYRGLSPDEMEQLVEVEPNRLVYVDTDVFAGTRFHYAVSAHSAVGEGPLSEAVSAVPFDVPSVPRSLDYDHEDGFVSLSWTSPERDWGRPVTVYRIYRGKDPAQMALLTEVIGSEAYVDQSAVQGLVYHYAVSAVNEAGEGPRTPAMEVQPAVPIVPPGPPQALRARADRGGVILTWQPPLDDGGSPVTGYVIVLRGSSPDDLREVARVGTVLTYQDLDVKPGRTYHYAVAALNAVGQGETSPMVEVHVSSEEPFLGIAPHVWLAIAAVLVIGSVVAACLAFEPLKYGMVLLLLPLFSRFSRRKVLDNKNRYAIHGLIIDNPGIHFTLIMQDLDMPIGVATYHLDVLERENFVQSVRDGRLKRFYTTDTRIPGRERKTPEEIRSTLVTLVGERPGLSQKELIRELGVDRDTIGYHLRALVSEGTLEASKKGRYTVYRVREGARGERPPEEAPEPSWTE